MAENRKISEFPQVETANVLSSNKKIISELQRVSPSAVITLFEIDCEDLLIDAGIPVQDSVGRTDAVFRFHNNLKLVKQDIIWKGQTYVASPIQVVGYEASAKGTSPTPKLQFYSDEKENPYFNDLRVLLRRLDDIVGARVTRIRTFAKYLDLENFYVAFGGVKTRIGSENLVPEGFEPDPLAEFPREIFYIERKTGESRQGLELELSSPTDVENLQLPSRLVIARTCQWDYRGEGCLYEYAYSSPDAATRAHAKETFSCDNLKTVNLPVHAAPVANDLDELIKVIVPEYNPSRRPTEWSASRKYNAGDSVYIEKNNRKYYFVCKVDNLESARLQPTTTPPNISYWEPDMCSKSQDGCKLRWSALTKSQKRLPAQSIRSASDVMGDGDTHNGHLPFGGFPSVKKLEAYN